MAGRDRPFAICAIMSTRIPALCPREDLRRFAVRIVERRQAVAFRAPPCTVQLSAMWPHFRGPRSGLAPVCGFWPLLSGNYRHLSPRSGPVGSPAREPSRLLGKPLALLLCRLKQLVVRAAVIAGMSGAYRNNGRGQNRIQAGASPTVVSPGAGCFGMLSHGAGGRRQQLASGNAARCSMKR